MTDKYKVKTTRPDGIPCAWSTVGDVRQIWFRERCLSIITRRLGPDRPARITCPSRYKLRDWEASSTRPASMFSKRVEYQRRRAGGNSTRHKSPKQTNPGRRSCSLNQLLCWHSLRRGVRGKTLVLCDCWWLFPSFIDQIMCSFAF